MQTSHNVVTKKILYHQKTVHIGDDLRTGTLTLREQFYFAELRPRSFGFGFCTNSDQQLALLMKCSVRTIQRMNASLERKGYIRRETYTYKTKLDENEKWMRSRKIYITYQSPKLKSKKFEKTYQKTHLIESDNNDQMPIGHNPENGSIMWESSPNPLGLLTAKNGGYINRNKRVLLESMEHVDNSKTETPKKSTVPLKKEENSLESRLKKLNWLDLHDQQKQQLLNTLDDCQLESALACYALSKKPIDDIVRWLQSAGKGGYEKSYSKEKIAQAYSHNALKTALFTHCRDLGLDRCLTITNDKISLIVPGNEFSIAIHQMTFEKVQSFARRVHLSLKNTEFFTFIRPRWYDESRDIERFTFNVMKFDDVKHLHM